MEFRYMFMTAPNTIFAVDNRTIGNNNFSYFNTSVYELNKNRHAFKIAGQAQDELLPEGSMAKRFYDKWKSKAFETLSKDTLQKMSIDIESLKQSYSYDEIITDTTFKGTEYAKGLIDIEDAKSLLDENSLDNILSNIEKSLNQTTNQASTPTKNLGMEI